MSEVTLKTFECKGGKFEITVSETGYFHATVAGDYLSEPTLEALQERITKAARVRKQKISMAVTILGMVLKKPTYGREHWQEGIGVRHITLTGVHGGSGNITAIDDLSGDKFQLSRYDNRRAIVKRLGPEAVEEYLRLAKAQRAANKAYEAFESTYAIKEARYGDLDKFVSKLQSEATDAADETAAEAKEDGDPR